MSSIAAADPYAWKDAGFEGQCAVIMGYGGGVSDKVLQALTESGMKVAIVSRTQAKLDAAAAKYNETLGDGTVQGFSFDMTNTAGVTDLFARVAAGLGGDIRVVWYNAVCFSLPYDAPADQIAAGCALNFGTLWASFGAVVGSWVDGDGGVFMMSGGGFANNGAYSVNFGAQFGSTQKAFMKNFAESTQATYGDKGISVCALEINSLVFGGNIPDEMNTNPEGAAAFEGILKAAIKTALSDKTGACYTPVGLGEHYN